MRALVTAAATLAVLAVAVPGARADGDPASDVLYFQDAYLPYSGASKAAADDLRRSIEAAKGRRYAIKVAVIATPIDLGAVPSLFGRPGAYAQFLGEELRTFYTGPLLIAMPAGFGFWKGGDPTQEEERVLAGVTLRARTVNELVGSAAAAVRRLAGVADSPRTRDRRPPTVRAMAAKSRLGRRVKLRYRVRDDSGRSREVVRVYGPDFLLFANIVSPLERARGRVDSVAWRVPKHLQERRLRFCVLARDAAGNAARPSCARLTLTRR